MAELEPLLAAYKAQKEPIQQRLQAFKSLPQEKQLHEFLFCLLTPQSNAQKCWSAVEEIMSFKSPHKLTQGQIALILQTKTRFHNNKSRYVLEALQKWPSIQTTLKNSDVVEIRNSLAETINGYGLKEASHFLRNIGLSENKVAILDRHILRNLKSLEVIKEDKIKNKKHYLQLEQEFLAFSKKIKIPVDELDLLFWSKETGEIFK